MWQKIIKCYVIFFQIIFLWYFLDGPGNDITEPSISEDITVETLPIKSKKGRPRKNAVKTEKKKTKIEDKPKAKIVRGMYLVFIFFICNRRFEWVKVIKEIEEKTKKKES